MNMHHLFISHSWNHGDQYDSLVRLLERRSHFCFKNYSVSKDDPISNVQNDSQLRAAIKRQMQPCRHVLVLDRVYSNYCKWIKIEIDLAKHEFRFPNPIIAIKSWRNTRISAPVRNAATRIVNWNTESVVSAIRGLS